MSVVAQDAYRKMLVDLGSRLWKVPRWRTLIAFYSTVFGAATAIGLSAQKGGRRQRKNGPAGGGKDGGDREAKGARGGKNKNWAQFTALLKIAFPSLICEGTAHGALYTVLLISRVAMTIKLTDVGARGVRIMMQKDWTRVFQQQSIYMSLCVPIAMCNAMMRYEQNQLSMGIRRRLVDHIHTRYFNAKHMIFYRMSSVGTDLITTVDQRITADLDSFATGTAEVYGNLLKPMTELILFSWRISQSIGGSQLAIFMIYFAGSSLWLKRVMPSFGRITARQQELEGRFRSRHANTLSNAEEIAFLRGAAKEQKLIDASFGQILANKQEMVTKRAYMSFLDTTMVKHFGGLLSYWVMIPSMYLGVSVNRLESDADRVQHIIQSMSYFGGLAGSLNTLYQSSYQGFTKVFGLSSRVSELVSELENRGGLTGDDRLVTSIVATARASPLHSGAAPENKTGEIIELDGVDIFSPEGDMLAKSLTLAVPKGQHLIIEGPNGAGKSSLLRTIGGLWPLCGGSLSRPEQGIMFVPQIPYICEGTLRELVTYPELLPISSQRQTDLLDGLMRTVGLDYLAPREGGWDTPKEFSDILSGGERQRIAIARVLYHNPTYCVLDEATAAVSRDIEVALVEACASNGITMISVSHRPHLRQFHRQCLKLLADGKGGWELEDITDQCVLGK